MEERTPPSLATTPGDACQLLNLSRCESTRLVATARAGASAIFVVDSTRFEVGRFLRLSRGHFNEEDAQIVGFGRRLTRGETRALEDATRRSAAEGAKEVAAAAAAAAAVAAGGGLATRRPLGAMVEEEEERPPPQQHPPSHASILLQIAARSTALLPSGMLQRLDRVRKLAARADKAPIATGGRAAAAADDDDDDAADAARGGASLPHEAADRVHGRHNMRVVNLSRPLLFAHYAGSELLQLPSSTTRAAPAPALRHTQGVREMLVHRQYEYAPPPSPPEESEAERRARLLQPSPPPPPPLPPGSPPPIEAAFVHEDIGYYYGDGDATARLAAAARAPPACAP